VRYPLCESIYCSHIAFLVFICVVPNLILQPSTSFASETAGWRFGGLLEMTKFTRGKSEYAQIECITDSLDFRDDRMSENLYNDLFSSCFSVSARTLIIDQTSSLTNIDFLMNVREVRDIIDIRNTFDLVDIKGLRNIERIGGAIQIEDNRALTDTGGAFQKITELYQEVRIQGNRLLTDINAFQNLKHVDDYVLITNNQSLASIKTGFKKLNRIYGDLRVHANPELSDISALSNLQSVYGLILLRDNNDALDCAFLQYVTAGSYSLDCAVANKQSRY